MSSVAAANNLIEDDGFCVAAFDQMRENPASIDTYDDLRAFVEALGFPTTEPEVQALHAQFNAEGGPRFDFPGFKRVVGERLQAREQQLLPELIDAFVVLGGNADTSGVVRVREVLRVLVEMLGAAFTTEGLLSALNKDIDDALTFGEFQKFVNR